MDVFENLVHANSLGKMLQEEEPFCLVEFPYNPLNENNKQQILLESQLTKVDTVFDNKMASGVYLVLHLLKYEGVRR